jgi:RNA polymerase sigma-70 factor (ECF subfamily)
LTSPRTSPNELAVLVAAVADRRDRQAFTRLFDHFAPRLNGYLLRLGADANTAEEITQEAMVTLWRKASLFDPHRSSLATWLHRIARNRRIDLIRRRRLELFDVQVPTVEPADDIDLDSEVDRQQRQEAVRIALDGLPKDQLALLRLAFFEGLSHSEIASRTGLPLGTVKSRIRLGFAHLRRTLEAGGVVKAD